MKSHMTVGVGLGHDEPLQKPNEKANATECRESAWLLTKPQL